MFPLRPPFFGYPFNNFYNYNGRRNNYYPYNIPYNRNINSVRANSPNITPTMPEPLPDTEAMQFEQSRNDEKKDSSAAEPFDNYFFEIFGLKLYFDDILLICLLFFLYEEGVKDQELFISLILLLLS